MIKKINKFNKAYKMIIEQFKNENNKKSIPAIFFDVIYNYKTNKIKNSRIEDGYVLIEENQNVQNLNQERIYFKNNQSMWCKLNNSDVQIFEGTYEANWDVGSSIPNCIQLMYGCTFSSTTDRKEVYQKCKDKIFKAIQNYLNEKISKIDHKINQLESSKKRYQQNIKNFKI